MRQWFIITEPDIIHLCIPSFESEEVLAKTIAHELAHCREYLAIGKSKEKRPKASEKKLGEYIKGKR